MARKRKSGPVLGAHVSTAGGLHTAFDRAEEVGCDTMQIFTKNASQWQAPPLADEAAAKFRNLLEASSIGPVVAHDAYGMFISENGLGGAAFPSLKRMEREVVDIALAVGQRLERDQRGVELSTVGLGKR